MQTTWYLTLHFTPFHKTTSYARRVTTSYLLTIQNKSQRTTLQRPHCTSVAWWDWLVEGAERPGESRPEEKTAEKETRSGPVRNSEYIRCPKIPRVPY